ncbi:MAG: hypothetical protein J5503_05320, partial [Muribaculaceae bacterium]|nr:hypothetical protein [Muribaculaceae bacterium]
SAGNDLQGGKVYFYRTNNENFTPFFTWRIGIQAVYINDDNKKSYSKVVYDEVFEHVATMPVPLNPQISEFIDYEPYFFEDGYFTMGIHLGYAIGQDLHQNPVGDDYTREKDFTNVDYTILDKEKVSFSIFTDNDEVFTFTPEMFPGEIDEPLTQCPYTVRTPGGNIGYWVVQFDETTNWTDSIIAHGYEAERFFDWRIGIQTFYTDNGQTTSSDIVYMEIYPQLQEAKDVKSTSFFADWSCNAENTYMINNFIGTDCGYFLYVIDKATQDTVLVQNVEPTYPQSAVVNSIPGATYTVEGLTPGTTYQYYVVVKQNTGMSYPSVVREVTLPENGVYMLGGDDQGWDCTQGTQFAYDAENEVYTATITFPAEVNYFGFTTTLAENNDDGGWAYIEPFRFGAISDEGTDYWYTGDEDYISLTWDAYHAIRIPGGEYKLTVDLKEMKLYIENEEEPQGLRGDVNDDKVVDITDATMLINYLLSGDATDINMVNANCDLQGNVDISDATTLINFLLNGTWPD